MKAVRLHEYGGAENLKHEDGVSDPVPGDDDVLIEAWATSVNPIDWKVRSGARAKDFPLQLPAILGKDVSGMVRAVGRNVRNFKPGDAVLAMADATYAERVVVNSAIVTHLPDGVDIIDAAALPLIALTADQLVRLCVEVRAGQRILVTGALGSVGRAVVHVARKMGAEVIAGVRTRELEEAGSLGAADVLALDDDAAIAALPLLDGVADTVGGQTAAKLYARVKDGGRFGYASVLPEGVAQQYSAIVTARVFAKPDASKVREFADDLRDGKFVLPIGHRMPLRDASKAHVLGEAGGAGKIVLECRDDRHA